MASDSVLIVGGGPAGLEAANLLSNIGTKSIIIEKNEFLGGTPIAENYAKLTHGFHDAEEMMGKMVTKVEASELIEVRLGTAVVGSSGQVGSFKVELAKGSLA